MARESAFEAPNAFESFLHAFWRGVDAQRVRPLREYVAEFHDIECEVAREYLACLSQLEGDGDQSRIVVEPDRTSARRVGPYRLE